MFSKANTKVTLVQLMKILNVFKTKCPDSLTSSLLIHTYTHNQEGLDTLSTLNDPQLISSAVFFVQYTQDNQVLIAIRRIFVVIVKLYKLLGCIYDKIKRDTHVQKKSGPAGI